MEALETRGASYRYIETCIEGIEAFEGYGAREVHGLCKALESLFEA